MSLMHAAALVVAALLAAVPTTQTAAPPKGHTVSKHAAGTFDVKIVPQKDDGLGDPTVGRMSIDKVYHGDLVGTGLGQMLTGMGERKDSGVYVAVERVKGTLQGKDGSFAVHHTGIMNRGAQSLVITIVPDSGTGELAGITGTMTITITDGKHLYTVDYELP